MHTLKAIALLLAAMATSSCATYPNSEPPQNLIGGEWLVEDIDSHGVIDYAQTTIVFGQDGRLSGDTACNRYFADYEATGSTLTIGNSGATKRACTPAVMDQESRFLNVLNDVDTYRIDDTGALILSTPSGTTMTARRMTAPGTVYRCTDGSIVQASYPDADTAQITYEGHTVDMNIATSASGARYVGGGLEWWTKGMTEGMISPLAEGEAIASARGKSCTVTQ